ncbi:MAG: transporter substrate-binding domain-containing protein [Bifidobacteriaceae bacterium]|jgi:ABC-type amino acid transport substrate-binding protein|nr:transporter substrate-binding domain-containing protein [Bifidobacteriaceae bacterium]
MKKLPAFILAAIMMPLLLGACGGGGTSDEGDAAASGPLRVGMEAAYAPFNWTQVDDSKGAVKIDGGGWAGGYDVAMAKLVAEKMGRDLVVVKTGWDGLIPALQAGKIDMIVAGMTPTAERKESIDFSQPYYASDIVVVVKKDSKWAEAKTIDELSGAKITGQLATVHYDKFVDQIPGVDKQTALTDFPTMILALKSGKIDGYVSERPGALSAVAGNTDLTFLSFPEGQGFDVAEDDTAIAIGLKKGSDLLAAVNEALGEISAETREQLMEQAVKDQPAQE